MAHIENYGTKCELWENKPCREFATNVLDMLKNMVLLGPDLKPSDNTWQ